MISDKPFFLIDKEDLASLVSEKVREGTRIEYKEILPGNSDSDKKEFLADVSSFANSAGGLIIYGIKGGRDLSGKATGLADSVPGLPGTNTDKEILRLTQVIQSGIEPRIPGLALKEIDGFPDGPVIVIGLPKSFNSPHCVSFSNSFRFYGRTSAEKHQLDVGELRSAFLQSSSVASTVRKFREERLARILAGETPAKIKPGPQRVLHILPINSFLSSDDIDITGLDGQRALFQPPSALSWDCRFNMDGFVSGAFRPGLEGISYIQVFRRGAIEYVVSRPDWNKANGQKVIPSNSYEGHTILESVQALSAFKGMGISGPYLLLPTLLGMKGTLFQNLANLREGEATYTIEEDHLILPDIFVEKIPDRNIERDIAILLRPAFDALAQAGGYARSGSYSGGEWKSQ